MYFGLTNFSVFKPGFGGWQESGPSTASDSSSYLQRLYAEERMETRCRIFFDLSIPQLADAAKQHDVTHFVQYSTEMPNRYQQRLMHVASQYHFLELVPVTGGNCDLTIGAKYVGDRVKPGEVFITYNLDDDDVLAASYFEQLEQFIHPSFAGFRVSLAQGYSAIWHNAELQDLRHKSIPLNNYGLAAVNYCDSEGSIISPPIAPHDTCDRYGPVVLDSRRPAYLNIRHVDQDTQSAFGADEALARLLSHSAHLKRVTDMSDFQTQFSRPASVLKPPPRADLLRDSVKIVDMLEVELDKPRSEFDICPTFGRVDAERMQVVASLVLVDSQGREVDDVGDVPMTSYSHNPKVKYHYYPSLSETRDTRRTRIRLPEGILCRAVRFHYLGPNGGGYELKNVEIEWNDFAH